MSDTPALCTPPPAGAAEPLFLGIDIAKASFDAHLLPGGQQWHLPRTAAALAAWLRELQALDAPITLVVMEASGGYENLVAATLAEAGLPVAIINPGQARQFAGALGQRAKNDPLDAALLARFGRDLRPPVRPLPDAQQQALAELLTRYTQLVGMQTAESNRLQTAITQRVRKSIAAHLKWIAAQLKAIDTDLDDLIKGSPLWRDQEQLLTSVPGIGKTTARMLLGLVPELGLCPGRQISALTGVAPFDRQSGKWHGRRFIGGGRADVRSALYMPTLAAMRCNPPLRALHARLKAAHKPGKLIVIACMRRLLVMLNAMLRDHRPWSPQPITNP